MNALLYCVNEIKFQIPQEILHVAFNIDEQPNTINLTSLDDKILRKCIRQRILMDCNVVRGVEMIIPLMGLAPNYSEQYYTIYNIPPELTNNREIISVLGLTQMPNQYSYGATGYGSSNNPILNVANRIGTSSADAYLPSNTHLELVAYNTIMIYANYMILSSYALRAVIENDNNLQNISPRSYKALSYLCVLGVKSYIYNMLIIKINQGYLQAGQELGQFKTILDSYEGAEEEYRVYLKEVWKAVAYMNDTTAYNKHIRSMLSPGL